MTQSLLSFQFTESHTLRVELDEDGEPIFHANDLCSLLGYKNPRDAIRRHVEEEDVVKRDTLTQGGSQRMTWIREPGLWSLIIGSETEQAKKVKRWVTKEVLPTLRKTGRYEMPTVVPEPERITDEQYQEIRFKIANIGCCVRRKGAVTWACETMIRERFGLESMRDLRTEQYRDVMALLDTLHEISSRYLTLAVKVENQFLKLVFRSGQVSLLPELEKRLIQGTEQIMAEFQGRRLKF